jgi:hypothetical protein
MIFGSKCALAGTKTFPTFRSLAYPSVGYQLLIARCNPAAFQELRYFNEKTKKDEWYFNTSIAEQTNVWVGGFHSMCREMRAIFYDFFLDQMVLMRNEMTRKRLVERGRNPRYFQASRINEEFVG